jgi:hypothetical protein
VRKARTKIFVGLCSFHSLDLSVFGLLGLFKKVKNKLCKKKKKKDRNFLDPIFLATLLNKLNNIKCLHHKISLANIMLEVESANPTTFTPHNCIALRVNMTMMSKA